MGCALVSLRHRGPPEVRIAALVFAALGFGFAPQPVAAADAARPPLATLADELRYGAAEHPKVLERFGGAYADTRLARYVQQVGERVVAGVGSPYAFRFTVLDSPHVGALSAPGGYVYVTRGLLGLANSEAELAAVLAHEAVHVLERHGALRLAEEEAFWAERAEHGLEGLRAHLDTQTRVQEFEADRSGIWLAARAGYDPMGQARLLEAMAQDLAFRTRIALEHDRPPPRVLTSHPAYAERIAEAVAAAADIEAETTPSDGWSVGRSEFLAMIDGISYGAVPDKGMAVGPTFVRTDIGVSLSFPRGYELLTESSTLLGAGPNGERVFLRHIYTQGRRIRLAPFLVNNYGLPLGIREVREFEVAGLAAVTGWGGRQTESGPVDIFLTLIRRSALVLLRLEVSVPVAAPEEAKRAARDAVLGLRMLTRAERTAAAPLRLEVREAGPATTVHGMVEGMGFVDHAEDRLRLLNALDAGEEVRPGRRLKVIVR